ncbi:hypothetical protein VPHD260_0090 [Vibrio phage D260]
MATLGGEAFPAFQQIILTSRYTRKCTNTLLC